MADLSDVIKIRKGRKPKSMVATGSASALPYLTTSYFRDRKPAGYVPKEAFDDLVLAQPEDVVLLWDGANAGEVFNGLQGVIASTMARIDPVGETLDRQFLYFYLRSNRAVLSGRTTGSTIPHVSRSVLTNLDAPIQSLPEQRAIAHVLRTVQRAKEATEQVIVAARALKGSMVRDLFMSKDWEVRPLGEVARIERGKFSHRPRNDPTFYGGHIPFVQTGDVAAAGGRITTYTQTLNEAGLAVSRVFPAGTIVITIAANIGHVGILEFDSAFPDSLIGITPTDHVSNEFLNYYLMTQQPDMDRLAPRGTQKNINIQFLKPWPVPIPPRGEQEETVTTLRAFDRKIAAEEAHRNALASLFDSLLANLMTARLRVTDLVAPA